MDYNVLVISAFSVGIGGIIIGMIAGYGLCLYHQNNRMERNNFHKEEELY